MNPRLLLLLAAGLAAALVYPWLVPNYLVTVGMLPQVVQRRGEPAVAGLQRRCVRERAPPVVGVF